MNESHIQAHLTHLSTQRPPVAKKAGTRELVTRYYDEISQLVTQGWSWDDIAAGFQSDRGSLKGQTIRKYFYDRKRTLDELSSARRSKRKRPSDASSASPQSAPLVSASSKSAPPPLPKSNDPFLARAAAVEGELLDD